MPVAMLPKNAQSAAVDVAKVMLLLHVTAWAPFLIAAPETPAGHALSAMFPRTHVMFQIAAGVTPLTVAGATAAADPADDQITPLPRQTQHAKRRAPEHVLGDHYDDPLLHRIAGDHHPVWMMKQKRKHE